MKVIQSVHPEDFKIYQTTQIRERFLLDNIIVPGNANLVYTHYDRMIVGGISPLESAITLKNYPNLRADYFLERREIGIINVGGDGLITAEGVGYRVNKLDCLYIGRGTKEVKFASLNKDKPAHFFLLSSPAHQTYPTTLMTNKNATKVRAGATETSNKRTINKYIFLDGIRSCQLVMGLTILEPGNVWNTMPAHVHDRRMEAYFYFDLPPDNRVVHYMGEGQETRHLVVKNNEAVISPPWSIHSGSGTSNYKFIWGMAGENQDYTDMDAINITDLK
ncbi:MAG: 5-dehydro-4-deoxy-D-glucuronate isomerase [Bacteroidota bacterium]